MLGYVRINERELTKEQRVRFRAVYCGVCEELREKCGTEKPVTYALNEFFAGDLKIREPEEIRNI